MTSLPAALQLEFPLVKISIEALSSHFQRVRKQVTRELGQILALENDDANATAPPDALRERLRLLREALVVADAQEKALLERCHRKLQAIAPPPREAITGAADAAYQPRHGLSERGKRQLERLVGEYLLRRGYFEGLALLEEEGGGGGGGGQASLFDLDIFLECRQVERQLVDARNCQAALDWCADHGSKLRRLDSPLEFQLHKQQFLELVRCKDRLRAIEYASQHLSPSLSSTTTATPTTAPAPVSVEQLSEIQQAMATLAFPDPEACPIPEYRGLFAAERWTELGALFATEARRCYGLTEGPSTLEACLQAGLTALKTPLCCPGEREKQPKKKKKDDLEVQEEKEADKAADHNRDCPVCSPNGQALAVGLPLAHFGNSYLTCRCTGEAMDGANPPMVLPNGRVYSQRAIKEHLLSVDEAGQARVTCPRTGESFPADEVKNLFVV